ncbi:hypothetical protein EPD60_15995 [Flaviaesturariibacter flavus]|uniref:Uncharacterized protein n=1 Tax=Flaviaesturariibacter flavus TaxID=2502780 RepID=A0A4R1B651_9BACT|nr:hypothetical protein [Flaviaesturariibacter flavus]TCJ12057.1 hypothetical protein EPD60_15995 [Flaviaesturariibacter flavus]
MGMQIVVDYNQQAVTYDVTAQEKDVYRLCLNGYTQQGPEYIPSKIHIRRKGKVWISDLENYRELVGALLVELVRFST